MLSNGGLTLKAPPMDDAKTITCRSWARLKDLKQPQKSWFLIGNEITVLYIVIYR